MQAGLHPGPGAGLRAPRAQFSLSSCLLANAAPPLPLTPRQVPDVHLLAPKVNDTGPSSSPSS